MKLSRTCGSLLLLAAPLAAQSVGVSLSAWTPLSATITDGAATSTATWPTGQLISWWGFGASLPVGTGSAGAGVAWNSGAWNNAGFVHLEHSMLIPGAVPTVTASTGPHEFLVELTATQPVSANIKIIRYDALPPGVGSPSVQLDYDNDGTIDVAGVPTTQPLQLTRQFGTQPFRVRILVSASVTGAEGALTDLYLVATPQNDLTITEVVAKCRPYSPPPPPFVQPSFVGRGITLTVDQGWNELGVMVLGSSPQPVLLGILSGLPCILVPAPEIVLFEPTGILEVPLPASLRPLTFYAQGVNLTSSGLVSTEGYAVTAF